MPNLTAFGATEFMDGALNLRVLNELFLRGAPSRGRGRPTRGRALLDSNDIDEEERERRRDCKELEAIDLTGCVSAVFVNALTEFVNTHLLHEAETSDDEFRRSPRRSNMFSDEPLTFPGLQRLGLRGVKSILPHILTPFILSFPSLTHLDLSGTRATPELLSALGASSVLLRSLALARCVKLTSESIREILVDSPATSRLKELSLYHDLTYPSPLSEDDLREILAFAPCFVSGELVYLDLSAAPLSADLLLNVFKPQPKLRSLGLSHIPDLELSAVSQFVQTKATNVEILTLVNTSPELDCGLRPATNGGQRGTPRQSSSALHTHIIRRLCAAPFSASLSLTVSPRGSPPTRLRVIELSTAMLGAVGAGAGAWRIIRSKGGRGWYVDTASGWIAQVPSTSGESILRRDLDKAHPWRLYLEKLSDANGNVSSGVGWHARKMEVRSAFSFVFWHIV